MSIRKLLPAALATCCLLFVACGPAGEPAAEDGNGAAAGSLPPVILISFDTTRADVFGVYTGEEPSLTPRLDEVARDSVIFENAFVQAPHTLPSHMSMITALYPDSHGVKPEQDPLPESVPTLPQVLDAAGYHTVGLVTSEWLKPDFGFGRGFDEYELLPHRPTYAGRVNDAALRHLRSHDGAEPVFLFLHYYDLHSDFDHGAMRNKLPYYSLPEYREDLEVSEDGSEFCDDQGNCNTAYLMASDRERRELPAEKIETIHQLYRAAVPHLDAQMGRFFDELKQRGLYDEAVVVITSDHGEEFREHGRFIHSQPYDETIRVPLFVKLPHSRLAGVRVPEVVETVDLMPTLLAFLGLSTTGPVQGEDVLGLAEARGAEAGAEGAQAGEADPPGVTAAAGAGGTDPAATPGSREDAVLSQDTINLARYGLRTDEVKIIVDLERSRRELYDLVEDPREQVNLVEQRPEMADVLAQRLERMVRDNRRLNLEIPKDEGAAADGEVLSNEERERLRALGYLN